MRGYTSFRVRERERERCFVMRGYTSFRVREVVVVVFTHV